MKKIIKISFAFLIPAFLVVLFWTLIYNSVFIFIGISSPQGMLVGISYVLFELYFIKRIIKNRWITRLGVFLALFVVIAILHFMINYQDVIRPIKAIFNKQIPIPAMYDY